MHKKNLKTLIANGMIMCSVLLSACSGSDMLKLDNSDNEDAGSLEDDGGSNDSNEESSDSSQDLSIDNSAIDASDSAGSDDGTLESSRDSKDEDSSDEEVDDDYFIEQAADKAGVNKEDVKYYLIYDFDYDGSKEAFIYIGDDPDEYFECVGDIWYVDDDDCYTIKSDISFLAYEDKLFDVIVFKDKTFAMFNQAFTTASVSYIYYVEDGELQESAVSGIGAFFEPDYVDDYCISYSEYDSFYDYEEDDPEGGIYTGHTWKHYYFYYDEKIGDFEEYDGSIITQKELQREIGFDLAGEIEDEGYDVDTIFIRDNGIININYSLITDYGNGSYSIEYHNVTYNKNTEEFVDVWGEGEKTWQASDFGGIYLDSISG